MNYVIVCRSSSGGPEYALSAVIGLALTVALWTHHRRLARRAARQILPLK